jgi:hypothetical protein
MVRLLIKLLGEARGNAVWDAIVRICQWGWPFVLTAFTYFWGILKHSQIWQLWGPVIIVCLVSYAIAIWLHKRRNHNPIEKSKRKTKEERNKETVDIIARRAFPERFESESPETDKPFQPDDQARKRFTAMVDYIKSQKESKSANLISAYYKVIQPATIGALVTFSPDIQTEDELKWHCDEFEKHGYGQPFERFKPTSDEVLQGQWLSVLKEARHKQRDVKTEGQLLEFLAMDWSGKDKWSAAMRTKKSTQLPVMPEFVGEFSGKVAHKCSKCGFVFLIQNPRLMAIEGGGKPVVTCPNKKCGQIDFVEVEKEDRQETKEHNRTEALKKLGEYQEALNQRYNQIASMEFWDYANKYEHFYKTKAFDPETQILLEEIEGFLDSEIAGASADFKDTINLQYTRISPAFGLVREKAVYWQLALDHLKHRTNQLAKIKDKLFAKPL